MEMKHVKDVFKKYNLQEESDEEKMTYEKNELLELDLAKALIIDMPVSLDKVARIILAYYEK